MEEYLLTPEEIDHIVKKAKFSILNNPGFVGQSTKNRWDIFSISPNKKLIFIQGDHYTGLQHINNRHRFYVNEYSTTENSMFLATSKFDREGGTLDDYIRIAEHLFDSGFVDPKNLKPEQFEVFKGSVELTTKRTYRLILYKDTKIVHTLFPIENKKPKKFRRGTAFFKQGDINTIFITIPWFDIDNRIRYGLTFKHSIEQMEEEPSLLIFENEEVTKQINFPKRKVQYKYSLENYIESLNYINVENVEEVKTRIEKGQIK